MNSFKDESTKTSVEDTMIFIVDEQLAIKERSGNVYHHLNLTADTWKHIEGVNGMSLNMTNVIINIDEILQSELGSYIP